MKSKVAKFKTMDGSRDELWDGSVLTFEGHEYPDYVQIATAYATVIHLEQVPACRYLRLAAKRFLDMLEEAKKSKSDYYFSPIHAVEPCAFIETLTHVKGQLAQEKIRLEAWQIWVLVAIYGFRRSDTGDRLVRIAQLEITRKQGKSLLAAGIGIYELGPNAYIGDDLYIIAPTSDLATKVLEPMQKMAEFNPALQEFYGITWTKDKLDVNKTKSYAVILPANGKKQDGHDPKVVIADEFHSLPADIFKVMKSSQGARPEALYLEIGSAGYNTFGVGWDERNAAIEVLEGKRHRPSLFCAIWTIDPPDFGRWTDERVIKKCNPNFGVSTPRHVIMEEIDEIKTTPRNKNEVLRTRFNVWGLGEAKLISQDQWAACEVRGMKINDFKGEKVWIGADLATRNDMICFASEFDFGDRVFFFAKHYVPEIGPWREDEEVRDLYESWHKDGWLTYTPGSHHSYNEMYNDILAMRKDFKIEAIVIDDREANALLAALVKENLPAGTMRKNATNYSEPTKDITARAVGKRKGIAHNGNPILAWNVENVIGATNTSELILPKKISDHSNMKIDGFDAMVEAHTVFMGQMEAVKMTTPQPMAERGMRIL